MPGGPALNPEPHAAADPVRASSAPGGPLPVCPACQLEPPPLASCVAALPYAYPWNRLITRLKFEGEPGLARPLAALMLAHPGVARALAESEWVVPLPLSVARLQDRGYNQALELARRLCRPGRLGPHLLRRVQHTTPQTQLDREGRLRNLAQAFAVDPRQAATIRDRRLLLVDDVMTSGATLHAAARALKRAGAASVRAVVLARTDRP